MGYYFLFRTQKYKVFAKQPNKKPKRFPLYELFHIFAFNMEPQKEITISIIIPVYNVSAYIERCLKSVIKQTYNHFECILVDDASPDDSIAKCEQMIADYDGPIQFRILHHEHNRGLSAARNTGTDAATGDYILYVDSDDIISSDCVEKLMAPVLIDDRVEMVFGGWMRFSDNKPFELPKVFKRQKKFFNTKKEVRNYYYGQEGQFIAAAWNKLVSREFLNRHHLRFREGQLWEDVLWSFFVLKHLNYLYSIPDVTYFYYQRDDSISEGTDKKERLRHYNMISSIISANFTSGEEGREANHFVRGFCNHYIRSPKTKELRATAQRFSKALPFRKYPKEKTLLWAAMLLPHNQWGKEIFKFVVKSV